MAVEPIPGGQPDPGIREKLRVAGIVEDTVSFYRRHFISFLTVFLIANAIVWTVQYYASGRVADAMESRDLNLTHILEHPEESAPEVVALMLDIFLLFLATSFVLLVVMLVFHGASIRFVQESLSGGQPDWSQSFAHAFSRFPRLLGATIIAGMIVVLGLVAFVIPGLVIMMMFILVPQAVVLEDRGSIGALSRSSRLTSGNKMTIFLFFLFWVVVLSLFYMILGSVPVGRTFQAVEFLASTLFAPVIPISTTVMYHKLNVYLPEAFPA